MKRCFFAIAMVSVVAIDYGESATLTAFAPGAVEYRWTLNGEPISVEGTAATMTVTHRPSGSCVIIR